MNPERFQAVGEHLAQAVEAGELPNGVAEIWLEGNPVYITENGWQSIEKKIPATRSSIFRLASMTKPVTAVAIMQQVEQGRLELDEPVAKKIPAFSGMRLQNGEPARHAFTVRELLTHSSGLLCGTFWNDHEKRYQPKSLLLADIMPRYGDSPLAFQPGTMQEYSAVAGFDVLARLVEITSGQPFGEYVKDHMFLPLGMLDTGYVLTQEQWKRMVTMYTATPEGQTPFDMGNSTFGFMAPGYPSGGAGLAGTLADYVKFVRMLYQYGTFNGKQILSKESVLELARPQLPFYTKNVNESFNWGLSMRVVCGQDPWQPLTPYSFGWSGAYGTHFWIDRQKKLFAVLMCNMTNANGAGSLFARQMERDVMAAFDS